MDEDSKPKFNITMLFDEDDDLTQMKLAVQSAAEEAWGKDKASWPKKRRMPFRSGTTDKPGNPEYEGKIFVFASANEDKRPSVVARDGATKLDSVDDFYSGCYARASLIAFHYKVKGNEGVSFALRGVQKWDDGEKFAGAGEKFAAIDDDPSDLDVDLN